MGKRPVQHVGIHMQIRCMCVYVYMYVCMYVCAWERERDWFWGIGSHDCGGWQVWDLKGRLADWRSREGLMLPLESIGSLDSEFPLPWETSVFFWRPFTDWKRLIHIMEGNCVCVHACILSHFSHVWLFATLWIIACQSPLSTGFSRQGYWSLLLGDGGQSAWLKVYWVKC